MAILAYDPDARAHSLDCVRQRRQSVVELPDESRHIATGWAATLGLVVKMGQVNQRQVGPMVTEDFRGAVGDPLGAGQACHRPPKGRKREPTALPFDGIRKA